jgi:2,4-dienoyl-CoA reductase (NADPH2)
VRIVARIAQAIRASAPDVVLGIRLSLEGGEEAGNTVESLTELLPLLVPHLDYVNLTAGVRTTYVKDMGTEAPPLLDVVDLLRPLLAKPLLVSQAFRRAEQIEAALAAGADLVGMARPLIADPDFPSKLLAGRSAAIRPCVSCNEDCRAFDPQLLCSVNPELAPPGHTYRPAAPLLARRGDAPVGGPVAIVGGGPAGLECASTLAGTCEVVLFDEHARLGGHLAVAAAAPHRHGWQALLDFYAAGLAAGEVTVRLEATADADDLGGFAEVVLATGSREVLPGLPGIERALGASQAIAAGVEALAGRAHVLIADDGFGSWLCASALELAISSGVRRITVATPSAAFGASLPAEGRAQLLPRLRGAPLEVRPFTALEALDDELATLRNVISGAVDAVGADAVIVVGERRARDWSSLVPYGPTVQVIGDALVPRRVGPAVSEGRAAAEAILARVHAGRQVGAPA